MGDSDGGGGGDQQPTKHARSGAFESEAACAEALEEFQRAEEARFGVGQRGSRQSDVPPSWRVRGSSEVVGQPAAEAAGNQQPASELRTT